MQQPNLTSEDKIWAALAHGSALMFMFGPIVAAVVWFTQRKQSPFARFHALQAMVYQVVSFWLWIILVPILVIVMVVVMIVLMPVAGRGHDTSAALGLAFPLVIWGGILGVFAVYFLVGLIGAVAVLTGRDFRYPLMGNWLARHLEYSLAHGATISESQEDTVAACVSHATCILTFWGIITPLLLWITQKDKSAVLRFQALQAAIYQGIGTVVSFVWTAAYFVIWLGMLAAGILATPVTHSSRSAGGAPIAILLLMIPMLCLVAGFYILLPLYHLFGFIASIRVLKGRDYRYPILGGFLARRMGLQPGAAQETAQ